QAPQTVREPQQIPSAASTRQPVTGAGENLEPTMATISPVRTNIRETAQVQPAAMTGKTESIESPGIYASETPFFAEIIDNDPEPSFPAAATHEMARDPFYQFPYSRESVVNLRLKMRRPLEWQWFFTPTISYRKLGENKSYLQQQGQYAPAPAYDVNTAVTHKPDLGFQLGLITKYPVTKSLRLLTGLQFNVARYDIKAFSSPYSVATIRLNSVNSADSVTSLTNYNNFNGYRSNWLENIYLQVSAPVGIELKIRGDEKMQFGIATTIQPTYVLRDRAYLISTDYKNYAQIPDLVRRWNVNTNIETFVSYTSRNVKWQVGPQVRYQLLSSFVSKYPVKENLFDFGLKVGVSRNK
ncbi:MAG TPA: hypothetical protein VFZ78_03090, partial [Flavisolibacter sp.]